MFVQKWSHLAWKWHGASMSRLWWHWTLSVRSFYLLWLYCDVCCVYDQQRSASELEPFSGPGGVAWLWRWDTGPDCKITMVDISGTKEEQVGFYVSPVPSLGGKLTDSQPSAVSADRIFIEGYHNIAEWFQLVRRGHLGIRLFWGISRAGPLGQLVKLPKLVLSKQLHVTSLGNFDDDDCKRHSKLKHSGTALGHFWFLWQFILTACFHASKVLARIAWAAQHIKLF